MAPPYAGASLPVITASFGATQSLGPPGDWKSNLATELSPHSVCGPGKLSRGLSQHQFRSQRRHLARQRESAELLRLRQQVATLLHRPQYVVVPCISEVPTTEIGVQTDETFDSLDAGDSEILGKHKISPSSEGPQNCGAEHCDSNVGPAHDYRPSWSHLHSLCEELLNPTQSSDHLVITKLEDKITSLESALLVAEEKLSDSRKDAAEYFQTQVATIKESILEQYAEHTKNLMDEIKSLKNENAELQGALGWEADSEQPSEDHG